MDAWAEGESQGSMMKWEPRLTPRILGEEDESQRGVRGC